MRIAKWLQTSCKMWAMVYWRRRRTSPRDNRELIRFMNLRDGCLILIENWCKIAVFGPLGSFGTLGPYNLFVSWTPLGPLGPLALILSLYLGPFWDLLGPLALKYLSSWTPWRPLGPLALEWFFLTAFSEHGTRLRREWVFQF